jgi:exosortase A-associated hydrolase 1
MSAAHPREHRGADLKQARYTERGSVFACEGEPLVGIAAIPEEPRARGVLVAVGGPQYRVGSHRQFALLCRTLAAEGYPTFRFDYRGMGDSTAPPRNFEQVGPDLAAALDAFSASCSALREIVVWGLCDAASAALMFAVDDARVGGLVLLNPWVRDDATLAQARVKHYYGGRLASRAFWGKVLRGKLDVGQSLRELIANAARSLGPRSSTVPGTESFQARMARGLARFDGQVLLALSGNDLTAKEFLEYVRARPEWTRLLAAPRVRRIDIPQADHTFSRAGWRREVEAATLEWLGSW